MSVNERIDNSSYVPIAEQRVRKSYGDGHQVSRRQITFAWVFEPCYPIRMMSVPVRARRAIKWYAHSRIDTKQDLHDNDQLYLSEAGDERTSLVMTLSDRRNPVRALCSMTQSAMAIPVSAVTERTLIEIVKGYSKYQ